MAIAEGLAHPVEEPGRAWNGRAWLMHGPG
jgi:hypothetical protein